ncbi:hypothetical protein D2962_05980 [Biomaibacter acetigenes]|uniref:Uncharacterized protein n=1 Tax=Biomaibacter acetigenes TaxID=2316383 RepID=A0A3G2R455_9FIRM|nr:hypothetical protein [Biomaibacter acetigenes]AYO30226.1 hypothetical protein D2962_05980 [Biomaibacter acetigenes]
MELKQVTIKKAVPPDLPGAKITVFGKNYIGTKHYLIREDIAPKAFISAVNGLSEIRVLNAPSLEGYFKDDFYHCSDIDAETGLIKDKVIDGKKLLIIMIKTEAGPVYVNYNYYCYLKRLKLEFRFNTPTLPIGLFKNNELVGILCPIELKK